jgi:hypothetical protein
MEADKARAAHPAEIVAKVAEVAWFIVEATTVSVDLIATAIAFNTTSPPGSGSMEMDSDTRKQLIKFARAQMERRGEIDTLIFTARDIADELRKASDNLKEATTHVDHVLRSIEEDLGE